MIPTTPTELAWMMAGVVYPAHADEAPDVFLDDFAQASAANITGTQEIYVGARLRATSFIEKIFAKVEVYPNDHV